MSSGIDNWLNVWDTGHDYGSQNFFVGGIKQQREYRRKSKFKDRDSEGRQGEN
jgi:hypothetical protein